jgi:hypothetical protein
LPTFKKSTPQRSPLYCSHCQTQRGISKAIEIDAGLSINLGSIIDYRARVSRDPTRIGQMTFSFDGLHQAKSGCNDSGFTVPKAVVDIHLLNVDFVARISSKWGAIRCLPISNKRFSEAITKVPPDLLTVWDRED